MKKLILILIAALFMVGCNGKNEPSVASKNVYLSGFTIYKMPARDKYYMVVLYPETTNGEILNAITTPVTEKLIYSDLPYTKMCESPEYLEDFEYISNYTVALASSSEYSITSMRGCAQWDLKSSSIKKECILTSTDGKTKIGLLFSFR